MKSAKSRFPMTVRNGAVSVKVYAGESGGYPLFTVTWNDGSTRHRRNFRQERPALEEAEDIADRLARGHIGAVQLKASDADAYALAVLDLAPTGIPLNTAVREYVAAHDVLKGGSILEAARFFAARRPTNTSTISVDDAVEEFLTQKEGDGVGKRYLQDARSRLRRFSGAMKRPIASVTTTEMDKWLRGIASHPRTRNNFRQHLVTLFRWARDRGYLPREAQTEADRLALAKDKGTDVRTFSPSDLKKLLDGSDERLRPYLAIRAFAGVRDSEMRRLTWDNVRFDQGVIEIRAGQAKTASRRLIPIFPNLAAWLDPHRNDTGRIGYANSERVARGVANSVGVTWIHNGLRHGFGSHRLAVTKNAAQVAHEMGNTERMVHRFYKELVTEQQGNEWFSVLPETTHE